MRKLLVPIFIGCISVSFSLIPVTNSDENAEKPVASVTNASVADYEETAADIYNEIHLDQYGLSLAAFEYAWSGYQKLVEEDILNIDRYLTICDFSQPSGNRRLYIIDASNRELIKNTYVAHGKNSGYIYANRFSNKPESLQSSLGFFVTRNTYIGKHGLSLRIDGIEKGINDNAMKRTIVIHGADYVNASRAGNGNFMGRSWGCPAVPKKESNEIIQTIKNGTCFFIYHTDKSYLTRSKILND